MSLLNYIIMYNHRLDVALHHHLTKTQILTEQPNLKKSEALKLKTNKWMNKAAGSHLFLPFKSMHDAPDQLNRELSEFPNAPVKTISCIYHLATLLP